MTVPLVGLSGCAAPTTTSNDDPKDRSNKWGFTVAVGPEGRPVFQPGTEWPLQVQPGTTIWFEWRSPGHDIHVESQPAEADWSGHPSTEQAGFVHEHTFVIVGRYRFWCRRHRQEGMVGDIVVGECECGPPDGSNRSN